MEHVGTGATGARSDGGIDLKLRRNDEYVLVQVKHWNAYQVPHNDVHQLLGLMVNEGATGAILITSGEFTKAALEAATRQGHVQLIDGERLRVMLGPAIENAGAAEPGDRAAQLAAAAHGRPSARSRPTARTAARARRKATLVWWAIAVAGAVVIVVLILALLQKTRWSAGAASSAPGNAVERERTPSSDAAADDVATSNAAAGRAAASDACHE